MKLKPEQISKAMRFLNTAKIGECTICGCESVTVGLIITPGLQHVEAYTLCGNCLFTETTKDVLDELRIQRLESDREFRKQMASSIRAGSKPMK